MSDVTVTEVPSSAVRAPDMTPTQAAFRMLMQWARERMPDGNPRMPDGMLCAACMHMVSLLTAGYANESGTDPLPELHADIDNMFTEYKKADAIRRGQEELKTAGASGLVQ